MPRDDAAELIADNLHSLPHPDGRPRRLLEYSRFGKTPETVARQAIKGLGMGHAMIHLLERHGFQITHKDDPKPADANEYKVARLKCLHCGKELLRIGVDENMVATMSRLALRSIAQINPECPHD
jgi:hypothetical protein